MKEGWQGLIINPIILYLGLKKSRISRGIITVRRPCDQEFYSIGCCDIEELISFRLTHQILQIPTGTLSFWRLFFFKARRCKVIRSVFLMLIFCHETIQSIIMSIILHLFISSFLWHIYTYSNLCKNFSYIIQQSKNLNIVRNYALN